MRTLYAGVPISSRHQIERLVQSCVPVPRYFSTAAGTGIKKNDRSGRSIATRISARPEKQSSAREKRNPAPSRNVFGHDRPKSLEGGIVLNLDRFAIFPCPAETGESLPAPVDQERGLPG
jgi:hypothetical protein